MQQKAHVSVTVFSKESNGVIFSRTKHREAKNRNWNVMSSGFTIVNLIYVVQNMDNVLKFGIWIDYMKIYLSHIFQFLSNCKFVIFYQIIIFLEILVQNLKILKSEIAPLKRILIQVFPFSHLQIAWNSSFYDFFSNICHFGTQNSRSCHIT